MRYIRSGLIAAREAQGWTQERLAKEIGKADRSSIAHYERGKGDIPGSVLSKLCQVLNAPVDVLIKKDTCTAGAGSEEEVVHA